MDISIYFEEVGEFQPQNDKLNKKRYGNIITKYAEKDRFPDLDNIDIAIIGVKEDRKAINNTSCELAPNYIRHQLYELFPGTYSPKIADLGNIKKGYNIEDTYFALKSVIRELLSNKILPVIIGGSQDLSYSNYEAYENLGQIINMVSVDSSFNIGSTEDELNSQSYLSKIILHQPNYLFNYTNIGYQTYLVDQQAVELLKNIFFDTYRLGQVRASMEGVEPIVRNADMISIDMSSVRQSDAPANGNASPNGFYGEEICQIMRYAGLSDKLSSIGIYEMNPAFDNNHQTSKLCAQMIWYFIDGFYNRKNDLPSKKSKDFIKYTVVIDENKYEIIFYKSRKSDRWWMKVPCQSGQLTKYERHYFVPCSYNDYQTACNNDIPDRWWQTYQKLM